MTGDAGIRVGLIGAGGMGSHHARIAASLAECTFAGVFDADADRAEQAARQYGLTAYRSISDLCAAVDAVIVATPAATHAELGAACLQAGCHVLLEKPMAMSVADAETLAAVSRNDNRVLMIGHTERFNPAVTAAFALLRSHRLFAGEACRLSPVPGRDRSADIIFDLMIHDLDLALACAAAPVAAVSAVGHRILGGTIDHAVALVQFENGISFTLTASAVSQERARLLRLYTQDLLFLVDCGRRELRVQREGPSSLCEIDGNLFSAQLVEHLAVPQRDALTLEHQHFLHAIRQGTPPLSNAETGLQAVRLAAAVQECISERVGL